MKSAPLHGLLEAAAGRYLALDPEGRERLASLHGRTLGLRVSGTGVALVVRVEADRLVVLEPAGHGAAARDPSGDASREMPDVEISGPPLALLRALAEPSRLPAQVQVSGDAALAREFRAVLAGLDPDWEEGLARVLGDVAGHEAARAARALRDWTREAGRTLADDLGEYLREESRAAPSPAEVERFSLAVDHLRDALARLDQRIERLSDRLDATGDRRAP